MKTKNQEIIITIRVIENEQIPEWVKTQTIWVETNASVQTSSGARANS